MSTTALLFITLCLSIVINPTSSQEEDVYDASLDFYCGLEWADAANSCTHNCQSGKYSDCINLGIGYECFKFTGCKEKIDNDGQVIDEVQEVIDKVVEDTVSDHVGTSNYCGGSWADAMLTCGTPCSSGDDDECNDGKCFAATNCQEELQRLVADMLVTLLSSDMQEMQGEDSDVLRSTISDTLRNIIENQGVALDDVDLGEQSLITRRELDERYHQRSLMG